MTTVSTDLHAALTARIDELERYAQSAQGLYPAPWVAGTNQVIDDDGDTMVVLEDDLSDHIATWDPATVLRGLAEDRDVLRRHEAKWNGENEWCPTCWVDDDRPLHPCPEIRSLARRHGLEVAS